MHSLEPPPVPKRERIRPALVANGLAANNANSRNDAVNVDAAETYINCNNRKRRSDVGGKHDNKRKTLQRKAERVAEDVGGAGEGGKAEGRKSKADSKADIPAQKVPDVPGGCIDDDDDGDRLLRSLVVPSNTN